ncbi:MAG: hypothetical protein KDE19_24320 [Caldilineaceae bacterium]|nr:hypothetical protein [Caldilineaceae bacterium]
MNDTTQQPTYPVGEQTPLPQPAPIPAISEQSTAYGNPYQTQQQTQTQQPAPQPGATSQGTQMWQKRSDGLTLTAGYHFVVAALFLLGTIVMMIPTGILGIVSVVEDPDAMIAMFIVGFIAIVTLVLCLVYLTVGYGLWTLKPWARVAALALAVVSLFGVPIGTVTGGLTLWYLMQPEVAAKFEQP